MASQLITTQHFEFKAHLQKRDRRSKNLNSEDK